MKLRVARLLVFVGGCGAFGGALGRHPFDFPLWQVVLAGGVFGMLWWRVLGHAFRWLTKRGGITPREE